MTENIIFNKQNVKYDTGKASLIKVPKTQFKVWIPNALIRPENWYLKARLPDDMEFQLLVGKNRSGKKCSNTTLAGLFDNPNLYKNNTTYTTYIPKKIKPKKVKIDDSLKR